MNKLTFAFLLLITAASCNVSRNLSAPPETGSHKQLMVRPAGGEILITETFTREEQLALSDLPEEENDQVLTKPVNSGKAVRKTPGNLPVVVKDTIYVDDSEIMDEAMRSEKMGTAAVISSFVPWLALLTVLSPLFLLLIPLGIVLTTLFLHEIKHMEYVTDVALKRRKLARILLVVNLLLLLLLLVVIILIALTL